jgi:hypothetical protein
MHICSLVLTISDTISDIMFSNNHSSSHLKAAVMVSFCLTLFGCAVKDQPLTTEIHSRAPVDFSGSWELDYELSENPNDKLRYLYEITRSQIEQQMASRRDQARNGAQQPAMVSASAINALQGVIGLGRLTEKIAKSTVLTIKQSPEDIVVERGDDFALTCEFMAEFQSQSTLGKEYCGWQNNQLIFQVALPEGLTVTHRVVMSENGKRLNVATTVSSREIGQTFSLNRVYMPFEPGQSMYDCEYTLAKKRVCKLKPSDRHEN